MNDLDPDQIASLEDLAAFLRKLHILADKPTFRSLEQRTNHQKGKLPGTSLERVPLRRSTLSEVLRGERFPRKAFLLTFVEACGVDLETDTRWEQAWKRLAVQYEPSPPEAGGEHLHEQPVKREESFLTTLSGEDPEAGETATYLGGAGDTATYLKTENTPARVEIHQSSKAPELRLDDSEQVVSRHQERFIDGKPYSLQTSFYPFRYCRKAPLLMNAGSIDSGPVAYIETRLGIRQASWRDELRSRIANRYEADFFDLADPGAYVIEVRQTAFDDHRQPIRLTITVYNADRNRLIFET